MFTDSTTNTALCRWSLLFVFLSPSVQIPFNGCPEIHMHHPFSPADKATTSRKQPDPLPTITQERKKKEERRKKIHNAETHIRSFSKTNCMFCFCVSMQLHISNTEHVHCACNDYKLQELTFKCLNLYFCESY